MKKFEELATYYIEELERYSIEQFRTKPSSEEGSLGQMYSHLIASTYMQLDAIAKCKTETPSATNKKTDMGEKYINLVLSRIYKSKYQIILDIHLKIPLIKKTYRNSF